MGVFPPSSNHIASPPLSIFAPSSMCSLYFLPTAQRISFLRSPYFLPGRPSCSQAKLTQTEYRLQVSQNGQFLKITSVSRLQASQNDQCLEMASVLKSLMSRNCQCLKMESVSK